MQHCQYWAIDNEFPLTYKMVHYGMNKLSASTMQIPLYASTLQHWLTPNSESEGLLL